MQHSQVEIFCIEYTMSTPALSFWCLGLASMSHRSEQKRVQSYYNASILSLWVCLFVRYTNLRHCEGINSNTPCQLRGLGRHVLRAPPFKYLPWCRRSQKIFSSVGRDHILFNVIRSPLCIPVHPKYVTSHPVGSAY